MESFAKGQAREATSQHQNVDPIITHAKTVSQGLASVK
jgi:hypothetical protein